MDDPEPNPDREREQALLRCPDELAERFLDLRWERALSELARGGDLGRRYLLHGGFSCPRGPISHSPSSQEERTRREDRRSKFYESRDNLDELADPALIAQEDVERAS